MHFRFPIRSVVFVCAVALPGCETSTDLYLYKSGATVAQADNDFFECELAGAQSVPQDNRVGTTPVFTTPTQTNCYSVGNSVQCSTTGGQTVGGNTYTYDANLELRTRFLARCLSARGYTAVSLPVCSPSDVPEAVLPELGGELRAPAEGACFVSVTNRVGNIAYSSELDG